MKNKVSLNEFKSNLNLVKEHIINSSTKKLTHIEYRTVDEGMCDANLFVLPKSEVRDEFEAFVILCNVQIHFFQEWILSDTTSDNAGLIINRWMQPEIAGYLFKPLSANEAHKEIDWIIISICKLLSENKEGDSDRLGVYINAEKRPIETTLSDLGVNNIISGIGFNLEWNAIDIMYQTENDYVFFSWCTGA